MLLALGSRGHVSLWLGVAESLAAFEDLLEPVVDQDGHFAGSAWSQGFGFFNYEPGMLEAEYEGDRHTSLSKLLHGCSYHEQVLPALLGAVGDQMRPANCSILAYDLIYRGHVSKHEFPGTTLWFVGTAQYA